MKLYDANHVLHQLIPHIPDASRSWMLRPCALSRQLPDNTSHICPCNFVNRILYTAYAELLCSFSISPFF